WYTEANITNTIIDILDEYDISKKTLALTTVNAFSMVLCSAIVAEELDEGFNNFNFSHYHCAAYLFNLALKYEALYPTINNLKKLCKIKSTKYLVPELDVKHQYNSTYYMLNK
ncbi:850_t:CDS:2, partial [Gigaspora margarita]